MLRPSNGVADRASALRTAGAREHIGDLEKAIGWDTAYAFHHLRRVTREVSLRYLEHAARIRQRLVADGRVQVLGFAAPLLRVSASILIRSRRLAVLLRRAFIQPRLR